eukprot:11906838-Karenia_brevis.AAC.1
MQHFTDHWQSREHMENLMQKRDHFNALVGSEALEGTNGLLSLAHILHVTASISEKQYEQDEVSHSNKPEAPPGYCDAHHRFRGRCYPNRKQNDVSRNLWAEPSGGIGFLTKHIGLRGTIQALNFAAALDTTNVPKTHSLWVGQSNSQCEECCRPGSFQCRRCTR